MKKIYWLSLFFIILFTWNANAQSNENDLIINPDTTFQTMEGFGASLAYYENWLTAHPYKSEVYEAIFAELSLDILRVRNAYDYDPTMIGRVNEFFSAAETALGNPIKVLSTSWGPPAYLKSNDDRKNGGTLKYSIGDAGIEFDYSGFATWWEGALDEYNSYGINPTYISIQNEPDFEASWESCRLDPVEKITETDTIAGYNKALEAVYNMINQREIKPKLLGPETVGIGYHSVQNYINQLDTTHIDGIAHHLYHGVDENYPWSSQYFSEVGELYPVIPHFQTEYSRGDWFSLGGLIYKSLQDENAVAYLYWDLIWDGAGLVDLEFPWDANRWESNHGYIKTKEFFAFKQFSAFIHPGWKRIDAGISNYDIKSLGFIHPHMDSLTIVLINRSDVEAHTVTIRCPGYTIDRSAIYRTAENEDCIYLDSLISDNLELPEHSITTVQMKISEEIIIDHIEHSSIVCTIFPNPFSESAQIQFDLPRGNRATLTIIDLQGRILNKADISGTAGGQGKFILHRNELEPGIYFFRIENSEGEFASGSFIIQE